MSPRILAAAVLSLFAACVVPTADARSIGARRADPTAIASADPACTFSRGTTTCTTETVSTESTTHAAISGCNFGPTGIPGRRTRTFADTYRVTVTTTTEAHGVAGPVYDTSVSTARVLLTSTQISDVCEAL